jgi:hypothetical protein
MRGLVRSTIASPNGELPGSASESTPGRAGRMADGPRIPLVAAENRDEQRRLARDGRRVAARAGRTERQVSDRGALEPKVTQGVRHAVR